MAVKLTQAEADALISMIKTYLEENTLTFPENKGRLAFDVVGERKNNIFAINIQRKGINSKGCSYQARVKSSNVILIRLDINPTSIHINTSTGEKIRGSHLHMYNEDYEMGEAIPFDIKNKDLYETCYIFFKKFNILKYSDITYQCTL